MPEVRCTNIHTYKLKAYTTHADRNANIFISHDQHLRHRLASLGCTSQSSSLRRICIRIYLALLKTLFS